MSTNEEQNNAPIQTLRDGAVVVKLWRQEGENGAYVTATLGRTYQNKETGEYGEARSLSASDVLRAQALLQRAYPEMGAWKDHFREQEVQVDQPQSAEPARAQGLKEQRDAARSQAKPPVRRSGRDRGPEM